MSQRVIRFPVRATTTLAGLGLIALHVTFLTIEAKPVVVFTSPCSCEGNHGVSRWAAKTDLSTPGTQIVPITPSQIYSWQGPGGRIGHTSGRISAEEQWYAVTGQLKRVRVEDDGDVHIEMTNGDGSPDGIVVELPLGPAWCEMRKLVFSWTNATFPLVVGKEQTLRGVQHPIITVTGKAFYDIDHDDKDTRNNRRAYNRNLAVWEIHPVMEIREDVANLAASASPKKLSTPEASERSAKIYPDLRDANSALYKKLWAEYYRRKEADPRFFDDPEWPLTLAKQCAEKLGIAPQQ